MTGRTENKLYIQASVELRLEGESRVPRIMGEKLGPWDRDREEWASRTRERFHCHLVTVGITKQPEVAQWGRGRVFLFIFFLTSEDLGFWESWS